MHELRTSLTDDDTYPEFCARAAIEEKCFRSFRRAPQYTRVLEHVSAKQGELYLEAIRKTTPALLGEMKEIRLNDTIGDPHTVSFDDVGTISPTTLRYTKVLADLSLLFGPLDGMRICEIGVGYGGQCRLISALHKVKLYRLVDLPSVLSLSKRYLEQFNINRSIEFTRPDELVPENYDLVISNYAFSELRRDVQNFYLANILQHSNRGYMTYNQITPESFDSLSPEEVSEAINSSTIVPELPQTHPKNCLVVWGADSALRLVKLLRPSLVSRLLSNLRSQGKTVRRFLTPSK